MVLVPFAVKPLTPAVAVADHENVVPLTFDVRVTKELLSPEQINCVSGELVRVGVGLMVTVNVLASPGQLTPLAVLIGVTVMVATIGLVPGLVAVKDGMLPVPLAPRPIAVLSFAQLKEAASVPVKVILATVVLLQAATFAGWLTTGFALIITFVALVYVTQPLLLTPNLNQ